MKTQTNEKQEFEDVRSMMKDLVKEFHEGMSKYYSLKMILKADTKMSVSIFENSCLVSLPQFYAMIIERLENLVHSKEDVQKYEFYIGTLSKISKEYRQEFAMPGDGNKGRLEAEIEANFSGDELAISSHNVRFPAWSVLGVDDRLRILTEKYE